MPGLQRRIRALQWVAALLSALVAVVVLVQPRSGAAESPVATVPWILVSVGLVLAVWFVVPILAAWVDDRRVRVMARSGRAVQPSTVWVDQWGVYEESPSELVRYNWNTVRGVEETPSHAYVLIGDARALIVPRTCGEDDLRVFLTDLAMYQTRAAVVATPSAIPVRAPAAQPAVVSGR